MIAGDARRAPRDSTALRPPSAPPHRRAARPGRRHLHPRPGQALRRVRRRRRARPRHPPRRDLRAARPQRRRQDDDGRDLRGLPRTATPARCGCSARTRPTAPARWKAQLGIVLQSGAGDSQLTCREMLQAQASYYPDPRDPDEVLELVGLTEKARSRGKSLSGGQRRRLDVALGIVGRPTLLFLDEPTTGFDPEARRQFWSLIRSLRELGTTMLLTTHYLDEAEALADRVGVIARGRLVEVAVPAVAGRPGDRARGRQLDRGRRPADRGDRHADGVRAGAGRPVPRRGARPGRRPADPRGRLPADDRRARHDDHRPGPTPSCRRWPSVYRTRGGRSSSRSSSGSASPSSSRCCSR